MRSGKDAINNVRIVPDGEGSRAERVNRMIAAIRESQSQTRVACKVLAQVDLTTFARVVNYGYAACRDTDDFASLKVQYSTYRITGMRFDIYDQAPGIPSISQWGTFHTVGGNKAPANQGEVIDLSDSQEVSPGTGKVSLYWYPSGPLENSWYDVDDTSVDFGGVSSYVPASTANATKYSVMLTYVVDFRARR